MLEFRVSGIPAAEEAHVVSRRGIPAKGSKKCGGCRPRRKTHTGSGICLAPKMVARARARGKVLPGDMVESATGPSLLGKVPTLP